MFRSVAFRLALGYGALVVAAIAVISALLYFGTIGVLGRQIDAKLIAVADRLADHFAARGSEALQREIGRLLTDGVDQDTEDYLLLAPDGRTIVGNLSDWPVAGMPLDRLSDQRVTRDGRPSLSRLLPHRLPDGALLIVGRDIGDLRGIEHLVLRALLVGGAVALLLAATGAVLFRMQIERRIATIRRTAREIAAGDLSRRIPLAGAEDEFARLNGDINRMLDRIQLLMEGVREVSNAIAHDLRTPLGRIRSLLDEALGPGAAPHRLAQTARAAIGGIDELIALFDKLLQIAEAEAGTRRRSFAPVSLKEITCGLFELYDAAAEAGGITLSVDSDGEPTAFGDRDLLASAAANLIDNALKYAGSTANVRVRACQDRDTVLIIVEDDGPGIPAEERAKVVTRFYRLDRSRSLPGNGLGLAIVNAISNLHGGRLCLEDAAPGLRARIVLPRIDAEMLPNRNVMETAPIGGDRYGRGEAPLRRPNARP